jgi:hypothetical protein
MLHILQSRPDQNDNRQNDNLGIDLVDEHEVLGNLKGVEGYGNEHCG